MPSASSAQLVELGWGALEQKDEAFFRSVVRRLFHLAPNRYFEFWYTMFRARHLHRGERLFRSELEWLSDVHVVRHRRWLKRIFRKLRFRCKTDRERAIGAIVFGRYAEYRSELYLSSVFETYLEAQRAACLARTSKAEALERQHADVFATAAGSLGVWSVAEGMRAAAKIPRTLGYMNQMVPGMSDAELLRALKIFDEQLSSTNCGPVSELVSEVALQLSERLRRMALPLEEWVKVLPHLKGPVLCQVVHDIVGQGLGKATKRPSSAY